VVANPEPLEPPPARADSRPPAPVAAVYSQPLGLSRSAQEVGAGGALWRSSLLPGYGQYVTDRKVRGLTWGAVAVTTLASSIVLAIRAKDANDIYESAPAVCKQQTYDQAVNYQHWRDGMLITTAVVWGLNMVESYLGYGSRDPVQW
jgi:hypothetical protein